MNGSTSSLPKILFILLVFVSVLGLATKATGQHKYLDSLDRDLTARFEQSAIPGCAVTILNSKRILYQKSLGYADIKNQKPFDLNTTINIASVSKAFISLALIKAIQLGYFNLESDINKLLPFTIYNPYFPAETIRIKHLVTHTSGITDNDSVYAKTYRFVITDHTDASSIALIKEADLGGDLTDTTLHEFMVSYLSTQGNLYSTRNFLNQKPGTYYSYSNIGSALAAYLIETKAKMSFSDFTHKYIFAPLKMSQSDWFINPKTLRSRAIPYYNADLAFPFYTSVTYPDGGLVTSAGELSQFVQEMIKSLNNSSRILPKKMVQRMVRPFFTNRDKIGNYDVTKYNNGVFWELYPDGFIGHPGSDPGVSSLIEFNHEVGIVFLCNASTDMAEFKSILKKYALKLSGH
ncbi:MULTISPECIES: serine hydrolase [unclassified Spirosoma]|uniref:serine hydrolase domain-containing protein n=1 Tax=unclassified Spirosoma TaxID=2621999 RepID=UPI000A77653A|nr:MULTISPECIES: serine hydrolase domain-containing protein [unclassified Spirosoma]MBN8822683.1 beta-lactamase family protein [Spirosoma sp.]